MATEPIINLDDAKEELNIPVDDMSQDAELMTFVAAAIFAVEHTTGFKGQVRTVVERHPVPVPTYHLGLFARPIDTLTSVAAVDGSRTWDVANIDPDPMPAMLRLLSGPAFCGLLDVTFDAGFQTIPDNYNLAARIIVQQLWQTQRGAMGTPMTDLDTEVVLPTRPSGFAIPIAALELLGRPGPVVA